MGMSPDRFREDYHRCRWIFDLFAHGFDFLNGHFFPNSGLDTDPDPVLEDRWDSEEEKIKHANLEAEIVAADGAVPNAVRQYLDLPGGDAAILAPEFCMRLFALLSAIDRMAGSLNYLGACLYQGRGQCANISSFFEQKKELQQMASGHVIFKSRYFKQAPAQAWLERALSQDTWQQMPPRGEHLSNYFTNLLRIKSQGEYQPKFQVLRAIQDFPQLDWKAIRIGIAPLVEEIKAHETEAQLLPGPLVLRKESEAPCTFGISIAGTQEACSELCARAGAALRYLADQGCQIVLFPEMVVPDPVVLSLKDVLRELARQDRPRPGLVLAGTFTRSLPEYSQKSPFNVSIALNHCGEELWRQRKMQPYDMKEHEQKRFGLYRILKSKSCRENIAFQNRKLKLVDSPATGLRMMVLICEDATGNPGLRAVNDLQPNLILIPVMAGPLHLTSGFGESVAGALKETPGIFVVANSAALANAASEKNGEPPPLAIVGLPLLNVADKYRPLISLRDLLPVPGTEDVKVLIYQFPT